MMEGSLVTLAEQTRRRGPSLSPKFKNGSYGDAQAAFARRDLRCNTFFQPAAKQPQR